VVCAKVVWIAMCPAGTRNDEGKKCTCNIFAATPHPIIARSEATRQSIGLHWRNILLFALPPAFLSPFKGQKCPRQGQERAFAPHTQKLTAPENLAMLAALLGGIYQTQPPKNEFK
jgi:hypothetical protein